MRRNTGCDPLVARIVAAIADRRGVDPLALDPPLGAVVDTDALERLFEDRAGGKPRGPGRVAFDYEELRVTVDSAGGVEVTAPAEPGIRTQPRRTGS